MSGRIKYDVDSGIDTSVLIECLMCLDNVTITDLNRHSLEIGVMEKIGTFNTITCDHYINTVFHCPDINDKRINGEKSNGIIEIPNVDINGKELHSCRLLNLVAKLALEQKCISKDRFEKRFNYIYSSLKMYEQVSKKLLSDIQKHIFETQLYNSRYGKVQPANKLIGYTISEPLMVHVYYNQDKNELKGKYNLEDIHNACNPLKETAIDMTQENLTPEEQAIKERIEFNTAQKNDTVADTISLLDKCRYNAISRFNKKYASQLYKAME